MPPWVYDVVRSKWLDTPATNMEALCKYIKARALKDVPNGDQQRTVHLFNSGKPRFGPSSPRTQCVRSMGAVAPLAGTGGPAPSAAVLRTHCLMV